MNEYTKDIVLNKLAQCLNSQRNESLNGTIGSKNPKIRYYVAVRVVISVLRAVLLSKMKVANTSAKPWNLLE